MLQHDAGSVPAHHDHESENSPGANSLEQVAGNAVGRTASAAVATAGETEAREFWLPAQPDSARKARRLTAVAVVGRFSPEVVESALLLVSELVTNSIRYAPDATGIRLEISRGDGVLRVGVWDANPSPPVPQNVAELDVSGRGLTLIAEVSSDWGWESEGAGKRVWFELHD
ncbi:hypothetical protein C3Y87_01380 [Carbonactinospora thermoautotrophica]|nr:hypothetical protein [Carbonactinospora thermoautotrophica]